MGVVIMRIDQLRRCFGLPPTAARVAVVRVGVGVAVLLGAVACAGPASDASGRADAPHEAAHAVESWTVTAWGADFEVFPEVEPLVAGQAAEAHIHVTRLIDSTPLAEGRVEMVLKGASGEQRFAARREESAGIFEVAIRPEAVGEFDLFFRIQDETIRGGRVRVGDARQPGGVVRAPAPKGATDPGEPVAFHKEEQWRSELATDWVRDGEMAIAVSGLARVRPPAGGEASVTSPVDGRLEPSGAWPFVGRAVERGQALFRVVPRVAVDRSLATLEGERAALAAELATARSRAARLEELLVLEAASRREVEEARVLVETLEARLRAAERDLGSARATREGGANDGAGLTLRAPFAGAVADVRASPGTTVTAGELLARVVRTDVVWFEVAVPAAGARRIRESGVAGLVLIDPERSAVRIESGLRLVSIAPEMSPATGTVTVLIEARASMGLSLGTTADVHVLTTDSRAGIVLPSSAVVDDGGVDVVYLQLAGEHFVRQQVAVLERQGDRVLVDGLVPGQRVVSCGGAAIRRSSLMSRGGSHGHVH